ncbi:MAG: hypothetical protein EAZ08_14265 [Cytophagales bacterium]|nr:MAG: hypothetical protein EAZ08_14265 [Cytophagales bacterium]
MKALQMKIRSGTRSKRAPASVNVGRLTIVVNLRIAGGIFYEGIDALPGKFCNFLPIILFYFKKQVRFPGLLFLFLQVKF